MPEQRADAPGGGQAGGREAELPATGKAVGRARFRLASVTAIVVIVAAGGAAAGWLAWHGKATAQSAGSGVARGTDPTAAGLAAGWVDQQVSHGSIVACDRAVCGAIVALGFPRGNVQVIRPTSPYPLQANVVVVTPAVRRQFGSSLDTGYAPAVLVRFGSGAAAVDIRVVAANGSAAYKAAMAADLKLRKVGGASLLASNHIAASGEARAALLSGQVDARLLIVMSALASQHPLRILAFGTVFPGSTPGTPLRSVYLDESVPGARLGKIAYIGWVRAVLRGQSPTFRPQLVAPATLPGGQQGLQIEFGAPSPLGLFNPKVP